MKGYDQGRMDAWERIDAIRRRLGLAGFFNEQKIKRYPKGHPKAGEFMSKPKEDKKPVKARKVFNLNLSPVETEIDGNKFSLKFYNGGRAVSVEFLANGGHSTQDLPETTRRKAALWWRRSTVDTLRMLPDGIPVSAAAYTGDGRGADRVKFYEALGFKSEGMSVSGVTRGGKILPVSSSDLKYQRRAEIREASNKGRRPRLQVFSERYTQEQYEADMDTLFESPRLAAAPRSGAVNMADLPSFIPLPLSRNTPQRSSIMDRLNDDDVFSFADGGDQPNGLNERRRSP